MHLRKSIAEYREKNKKENKKIQETFPPCTKQEQILKQSGSTAKHKYNACNTSVLCILVGYNTEGVETLKLLIYFFVNLLLFTKSLSTEGEAEENFYFMRTK